MYICFDGKVLPALEPVLLSGNKGYRYGDGLFETIKVVNGQVPLFDLHMQRLYAGMQLLEFAIPSFLTPGKLKEDIVSLCNVNGCSGLARVRVSVSRGEGGVYEQENDHLHYLIESSPANPAVNVFNQNGWVIGIYPLARKSMDAFAALKSANYLPYSMAARFARQQQWDDCLLLNAEGNIADASIANLFLIKDGVIFTPAEGQGAVHGVMRKYLIEKMRYAGWEVREEVITPGQLMKADELFLTNAMYGLRWIASLEHTSFDNRLSRKIYQEIVQAAWLV